MKPLYRFTLNKETGKINVQVITEYDSGKWLSNTGYLKYKENGIWKYCYTDKMDKFLSGHVYSFNPDPTHAKDIIVEAIGQKLAKAQKEVERWAKVFKEIHIER